MPSGSTSGVPMSSGISSSWLFLKMKPAMWAGVYWNWTFGAFSLTVTSLSPVASTEATEEKKAASCEPESGFMWYWKVATTSSAVSGLPSPKVTPSRSVYL